MSDILHQSHRCVSRSSAGRLLLLGPTLPQPHSFPPSSLPSPYCMATRLISRPRDKAQTKIDKIKPTPLDASLPRGTAHKPQTMSFPALDRDVPCLDDPTGLTQARVLRPFPRPEERGILEGYKRAMPKDAANLTSRLPRQHLCTQLGRAGSMLYPYAWNQPLLLVPKQKNLKFQAARRDVCGRCESARLCGGRHYSETHQDDPTA
jgi:hypothetical protein